MKTLYESILDNGANIIYRFISNLKQFEPKDKAEAYTYYLAIRKSLYYILSSMDRDTSLSVSRLKLDMFKALVKLCIHSGLPHFENFPHKLSIINGFYDSIERNSFGDIYSTMKMFYSGPGYNPNPDKIPETVYSGFDEKKYKELVKKIYNLVVRTVNTLKHL